jgi:hypothetical protein
MRRILATLAVMAAGVAALGSTAGPASADDPNVTYSQGGTLGGSQTFSCQTKQKTGVLGQYGAWGYFIDGCTVSFKCPYVSGPGTVPTRYCDVSSNTFIQTGTARGDRVTMNARIRRIDPYGNVYGWSDKSCSGYDRCDTSDAAVIYPGQSASVQCNGVREARPYDGNTAKAYCNIRIAYRV